MSRTRQALRANRSGRLTYDGLWSLRYAGDDKSKNQPGGRGRGAGQP
jgi:hypothetical protein